jgi:hypothetical protein
MDKKKCRAPAPVSPYVADATRSTSRCRHLAATDAVASGLRFFLAAAVAVTSSLRLLAATVASGLRHRAPVRAASGRARAGATASCCWAHYEASDQRERRWQLRGARIRSGIVVLTPHQGQEASNSLLPINFSGLTKVMVSAICGMWMWCIYLYLNICMLITPQVATMKFFGFSTDI